MEERSTTASAAPDVVAEYPVVRRLASDATGQRLVVRHPRIGREELMHVLDVPGDPAVRERVLQELGRVTAVEHSALVPAHGLGEAGGVLYLTTQLVEGRPLAALPVPLDHDQLVEGVSQVASALDALHDAGVVHGSVTADTVIEAARRGPHGRVRWLLAEAGVARALGAGTSATTGDDDVRDLACLAHRLLGPADEAVSELLDEHAEPSCSSTPRRATHLARALEEHLAGAGGGRTGSTTSCTADGMTDDSTTASAVRPLPRRSRGRWRGAGASAGVLAVVLALAAGDGSAVQGVSDDAVVVSAPRAAGLPARVALPAGTVPGDVVVDPAGTAWVTDDNGDRLLRVAPDGTTAVVPLPVSAGVPFVPVDPPRDDVTAPEDRYSSSTYSDRILAPAPGGGVWYAWHGQLGRVAPSGSAADVPAPEAALLPLDIAPDGRGGVWLSSESRGLVDVSQDGTSVRVPLAGPDGQELRVADLVLAPSGDLYLSGGALSDVLYRRGPDGVLEQVRVPLQEGLSSGVQDVVVDPDGETVWVLDHRVIHRISASGAQDVPVQQVGTPGGSDMTWGPGGGLYWLDDASGRIGRLDPDHLDDFPEYLPVPDGATARAMTATSGQLLVSSMGPDGSAALLAVSGEGQAVDREVTADHRSAVLEVLGTYTDRRRACADHREAPAAQVVDPDPEDYTKPAPQWDAFFACLDPALAARDAVLADVALPSTAAAARDEVLRVDAALRAAIADRETAFAPDLLDQTVEAGLAVDRLKTALGEPRTGRSY